MYSQPIYAELKHRLLFEKVPSITSGVTHIATLQVPSEYFKQLTDLLDKTSSIKYYMYKDLLIVYKHEVYRKLYQNIQLNNSDTEKLTLSDKFILAKLFNFGSEETVRVLSSVDSLKERRL